MEIQLLNSTSGSSLANKFWGNDVIVSGSPIEQLFSGSPVIDVTEKFLNILGKGGDYQYFWQNPQTETIWFKGKSPQIPTKWDRVYFGVNPSKNKLTGSARGTKENIEGINCLFGEFDKKDGWTLDKIEKINPSPSIIVSSGGGWHCYWLFKETVKVNNDNIFLLSHIQHSWVDFVGSDPGAKDISRVLRVPGSINNKYNPPKEVEFIKADFSQLYDIDELAKLLPVEENETKQKITLPIDPIKQLKDISIASKILSSKNDYKFDNYGNWFEILSILKDYGEAGYGIAQTWSKLSDKYNEVKFIEQWNKVKPSSEMENGKSIGSLIYSTKNSYTSWSDLDLVIGPIEWGWDKWLPKGLLTLVSSESGIGKSALLLRLADSFITGKPWPDGTPFKMDTGKVLWLEAESAQALNLERAKKWGIPLDKMKSILADPLDDFQLKNSKHKLALENSIHDPEIHFIILDSLSGADNTAEKSTENSSNVKWLAELAKNSGKFVMISHHLRKKSIYDSDIVTLDRLRGSSSIGQSPRVIWAIDIPDATQKEHKRLTVIKSNLGKFPEPIGIYWKDDILKFDDAPEQTINETVTDKAADLLLSLLQNEPKTAVEIEKEFDQAGISKSTMKRAKAKLGVISFKNKDGWFWSLPNLDNTPFN